MNFHFRASSQRNFLLEASGKIAYLRRYCLGGSLFCFFSLLDPLRSIKRKTVGEFVQWRGYTSLWEAVTCTLALSPGKVELGHGGHEPCSQCLFLQWTAPPNGNEYRGGRQDGVEGLYL